MNHDLAMKYAALAQQAIDYALAAGVLTVDERKWGYICGDGGFMPGSIDVYGDVDGSHAVCFGRVSIALYKECIEHPYDMTDAELLSNYDAMRGKLMNLVVLKSIDGDPTNNKEEK